MPDSTILDLILAGDYAEAGDALDAGWPEAMLDTIQATALRAMNAAVGTSGSSLTIGTGPRTLTLAEPRGWRNGTPVRLMEAASPGSRYMVGKLTADETAEGVLAVEVEGSAGSGTYTSWTVLLLDSSTTLAAPPLSISQGGTGAIDAPGARSNLDLIRRRRVKGVQAAPPSSPASGDRYAVLAPPTGAFVGQSGSWATWTGAAWTFEAPETGDQSYDEASGKTWSAVSFNWQLLAAEAIGRPVSLPPVATTPRTLTQEELLAASWAFVLLNDGAGTVTLPESTGAGGCVVTLVNRGSATVTVNVALGGTINGATSRTIAAGASLRVFAYLYTYFSEDTGIIVSEWLAW